MERLRVVKVGFLPAIGTASIHFNRSPGVTAADIVFYPYENLLPAELNRADGTLVQIIHSLLNERFNHPVVMYYLFNDCVLTLGLAAPEAFDPAGLMRRTETLVRQLRFFRRPMADIPMQDPTITHASLVLEGFSENDARDRVLTDLGHMLTDAFNTALQRAAA